MPAGGNWERLGSDGIIGFNFHADAFETELLVDDTITRPQSYPAKAVRTIAAPNTDENITCSWHKLRKKNATAHIVVD